VVGGFPFTGTAEDVASWLGGVLGQSVGAAGDLGEVVRAVSRRVLSTGWGLREVATSLDAAFARAEDLVYIETPAIDTLPIGTGGDVVNPVQTLLDRLKARPALHLVLCLPRRAPTDSPDKLERVRDALAHKAMAALDANAPGRVGVFHPAAGRDRSLRLATTAVFVDDAYGLVGTSHLWRRGLSFDGGLAAGIFDERLTNGRPQAVAGFRTTLLAARLGALVADVPTDPAELVAAVRDLGTHGGAGRTTTDPIPPPDPNPTDDDIGLWDRDGSASADFNPLSWLTSGVQSEFAEDLP
jgi:hypothetical protein